MLENSKEHYTSCSLLLLICEKEKSEGQTDKSTSTLFSRQEQGDKMLFILELKGWEANVKAVFPPVQPTSVWTDVLKR